MREVLIVDFNGTAPTYTFYFAKGLQDEGINIKVLGANNEEYLSVHQQDINFIGINSFPKSVNYLINWIYLLLIAKSYKAIHIQWLPFLNKTSTELLLIRILQKLNSNIFYTIHNFYPHDTINPKVKMRFLKLYGIINNLVVHTEATAQKVIEKVGAKNIIIIAHGYFYSEFIEYKTEHKKREPIVSILGFIKPYKGVEDAIQIIHNLKYQKNPVKLKLLIYGKCEPTYFNELTKLVESLNVSDRVLLKSGFLPTQELIDTYKQTDITLISYKKIEQSGMLMTSLGLGVPVVGYRIGGLIDVVKDGRNGYLVENGNIIELGQAIQNCLRNYDEIVANIHSDVMVNDWRKNAAILKKVYYGCRRQ